MYALKRIIAYAIDLFLIVGPISALVSLDNFVDPERVPVHLHGFTAIGAGLFTSALPVLLLGVFSGLTGRTPGKFITFLKLEDYGGDPPGIAQGILREFIKLVSLGFFFGMIWALQGVVTRGTTFYDEWLDLHVEDLRPSGLTETQKKFRKYMREQERKQKQGQKR
jgi:uncharacterized RDD family membrane protein YckC